MALSTIAGIGGIGSRNAYAETTEIAIQDSHSGLVIEKIEPNDDLFTYIHRQVGNFDETLYKRLLGAANEYKEGDEIVGVHAANQKSRELAKELLSNTTLRDIDAHPPLRDNLFAFLERSCNRSKLGEKQDWTLGRLKEFLLSSSELEIHAVKAGFSSDVIGCLVKLMSNQELIAIGQKVFNTLPGSKIGAKGYLGARIQPNSPTDHVDDIRWQVFDGFSYAVGDVLLGTNPVSSNPESVLAVEQTLQDILQTFGIADAMPHCVLAHIDLQAEVEKAHPKSTELWFQSIAGNDRANATFDVSIEKMIQHAKTRTGRFGLYFETGQGADFTNGHHHGFDMVLHESRKYGMASGLAQVVSESRGLNRDAPSWVHVNDVAGFIGPEVFRSKEQLVRCCLEDIVMGKLHGLTLGLDVCSTLHMDVSLVDLDWCLEQIAPANPAYLMALPTKIDPMLGYLTTGFHDHVRLRMKHGFRINDRMWKFFQELQVIDSKGEPTEHFGDPVWVYLQYCRRKNDDRSTEEIREEGRRILSEIRGRGVFIAEGFDRSPALPRESLRKEIESIYEDAKRSIWKEWDDSFVDNIPNGIRLKTQSSNRTDYILHPLSGEHLSEDSLTRVQKLRDEFAGEYDLQVVISEGLNALALMDVGNLMPLLQGIQESLKQSNHRASPHPLVVESGRVRAGYRIGELLFAELPGKRTILHIIGERPGSGHHTMSIYLTTAEGREWAVPDRVDHNITKVVSGIATTALSPDRAVMEITRLLRQ